eukprot:4099492-Amphidinium_carterae.1
MGASSRSSAATALLSSTPRMTESRTSSASLHRVGLYEAEVGGITAQGMSKVTQNFTPALEKCLGRGLACASLPPSS